MNELEQIQELFAAALQFPESERRPFVRGAPYSESVRNEVLHLLDHHLETSGFLDAPAVDSFAGLAGQAGREIGAYRIIRELGRGGRGVVYLARDSVLHRTVAIKVLSNDLLPTPLAAERFQRQVQAAARLSHSAIVPIYECGDDRGIHYIVMQYIEGESLDQRLESPRASTGRDAVIGSAKSTQTLAQRANRNQLTSPEYIRSCARLGAMIAQGLDCAHQAGLIHGDVKPSNILINGQGQALLTDFGMEHLDSAEPVAPESDMPRAGPYHSPERRAAHEPDQRADVFSLGVVLYQMLSLKLPFPGANADSTNQTRQRDKPEPLTQLNPAVPKDLETICLRALEENSCDRYPTAAQLSADLERFLRGEPIKARPATMLRRAARRMGRYRMQTASVLLVIAFASLAGGLYWRDLRATKASISIHVEPPTVDALVAVQRWDSALQSFGPAEWVGTAPIVRHYIDPGTYRLSIIKNPREFMELDTVARVGTERSFTVSLPRMEDVMDGMIVLRPGSYTIRPMRRKSAAEDAVISLEGFLLDRSEVSNSQYKEFVEATGHHAPAHWGEYGYDPALADRPVVNVAHSDAAAYARWRGKRLPTAAEWEAAARAPDARLYPWDPRSKAPEEYNPGYEVLLHGQTDDETLRYNEYTLRTRDVDDDPFPHTVSGFFHLFGNVAELASTAIDHNPEEIIIKGGSWTAHPDMMDLRRVVLFPSDRAALHIGFRCARSLEPPPYPEP